MSEIPLSLIVGSTTYSVPFPSYHPFHIEDMTQATVKPGSRKVHCWKATLFRGLQDFYADSTQFHILGGLEGSGFGFTSNWRQPSDPTLSAQCYLTEVLFEPFSYQKPYFPDKTSLFHIETKRYYVDYGNPKPRLQDIGILWGNRKRTKEELLENFQMFNKIFFLDNIPVPLELRLKVDKIAKHCIDALD